MVWYPNTTEGSFTQVTSKPSLLCYYYGKIGHASISCRIKLGFHSNFYEWISKVSCLMATNSSSREHVIFDSGYSIYMTGHPSIFSSFVLHDRGIVTFREIARVRLLGRDVLENLLLLKNVYLVDGLKHKFLSISKLCDVNKRVLFESSMCKIQDRDTNNVFFCGDRKNNVYIINTIELYEYKIACLSALDDKIILCHRKAQTHLLEASQVLKSHFLVRSLPKISDSLVEHCFDETF